MGTLCQWEYTKPQSYVRRECLKPSCIPTWVWSQLWLNKTWLTLLGLFEGRCQCTVGSLGFCACTFPLIWGCRWWKAAPWRWSFFPVCVFLGLGVEHGGLQAFGRWAPCTYCSAPRPLFMEKVLKETDWSWVSSSIHLWVSMKVV